MRKIQASLLIAAATIALAGCNKPAETEEAAATTETAAAATDEAATAAAASEGATEAATDGSDPNANPIKP